MYFQLETDALDGNKPAEMVRISVEQSPQGIDMDIQRVVPDRKVRSPHEIEQFTAAVDS
jgi:hypothetical protein